MSFICESCDVAQPTGTSPRRTVTEVRVINAEFSDAREEIAAEKNLCSPCAAPWIEAAAKKERQRYAITGGALHD